MLRAIGRRCSRLAIRIIIYTIYVNLTGWSMFHYSYASTPPKYSKDKRKIENLSVRRFGGGGGGGARAIEREIYTHECIVSSTRTNR